MAVLGIAQMLAARLSGNNSVAAGNSTALFLCIVGLLGVFTAGYAGYFVFDAIWPSFYYSPIDVGKNAWLLSQALFIAFYFAGTLLAFSALRRTLDAIPTTATENRERA